MNEFPRSKGYNVGRPVVGNGVLGKLEAGNENHLILIPSPRAFGSKDLEVHRVGCGSQSCADIAGCNSYDAFAFAKMVGNSDRAEAPAAVKVHQLWDAHFPVTEGRVDVKVRQEHLILLSVGCVEIRSEEF